MAQEGHVERACDRCRERRVKCDKRHPACLRCEKLGKPCPGYDKKRKFVDEGVNLRRKYFNTVERGAGLDRPMSGTESVNSPDIGAPATLKEPARLSKGLEARPTSTSSTPLINHAGIATPQPAGTGSGISLRHGSTADGDQSQLAPSQPFEHGVSLPTAVLQSVDVSPDDTTLDDAWHDPWFDPQYFDLQPDDYYSQTNNSCGFMPEQPTILDEVDRVDFKPAVESKTEPMASIETSRPDGKLFGGETQKQTSQLLTDEREHELAFLIRHFAESVGPWMDLFDSDKHFGHFVPFKALRDAMLRNAVAAVAAKQLARVKGSKPFLGAQSQSPARMEVFEERIEIDWFYKAANYYDKAIAFSRLYLQALSGTMTAPPTPGSALTLQNANYDDLLLAVSIFSMYEYLDNLEVGWIQHLTGMRSLLGANAPGQSVQAPMIKSLSVEHRASFWNFARADYQAAYLNRQHTLLDTEDLVLWQRNGLQIASDDTLYEDAIMVKSDPIPQRNTIDLVAQTLLWILLRVVNFSTVDDFDPGSRLAQWNKLIALLDQWNDILPDIFQPCAQIKHPLREIDDPSRSDPPNLMELFFSIDVCAATMQLYHLARILLLLNKPDQQASGAIRPAYNEVTDEAVRHARSVCGIALGRPHPAVRVEMLLPLVVAGSCLKDDQERQLVVQLLRAIEKDTGCVAEPKVRELHKAWGLIQSSDAVGR